MFNAIGDADLCPAALAAAEEIVGRSRSPLSIRPRRCSRPAAPPMPRGSAAMPGVRAPRILELGRAEIDRAETLALSSVAARPGISHRTAFRAGGKRKTTCGGGGPIAGRDLLAIEYLDARGAGRQWRGNIASCASAARFIRCIWRSPPTGRCIISPPTWRPSADHRAEEQRFLEDMPAFSARPPWRRLRGSAGCWAWIMAGSISRWMATDRSCCSKPMPRW